MKKLLYFPLYLFTLFFNPNYKKQVAENLSPLFEPGSYVLDFGCGDGYVANQLIACQPTLTIVGIDIDKTQRCVISRKVYDGKKIPYPDNTFDIVFAVDVLLHTNNILKALEEMKRVTKKYIIIKDNQSLSLFSKLLLSTGDFLVNAPYGVGCPFNYPTPEKWQEYFDSLNLKVVTEGDGKKYGYGFGKHYNVVFKLQK